MYGCVKGLLPFSLLAFIYSCYIFKIGEEREKNLSTLFFLTLISHREKRILLMADGDESKEAKQPG